MYVQTKQHFSVVDWTLCIFN